MEVSYMEEKKQTIEEQALLIHEAFVNRLDTYTLQKLDGTWFRVEQPITIQDIIEHLKGDKTISTYQFDRYNKVKYLVFDFDSKEKAFHEATGLYSKLSYEQGIRSMLLEFSGRKGYHIWVFCEPCDGTSAKAWANSVKNSWSCEIFPKQSKIPEGGFGNTMKLPLGIHRVSGKRTTFHDSNFRELSLEESIEQLRTVLKEPRFVIPKVEPEEEAINYKPINNNKTTPYHIEQLINDGVSEGTRNKMMWVITKELFNNGFTQDDIIAQMLTFNQHCKPKEPEDKVIQHVKYLIENADKYLKNIKIKRAYIG